MTYEARFQEAARLTQSQHDDDALKILTSLIDENPTDARIYALMGEAAKNRRNFPEALKALNLAKRMDPQNPFILIEIASVLTSMGRLGPASKLLDKIRPMFLGTRDEPLWAWSWFTPLINGC